MTAEERRFVVRLMLEIIESLPGNDRPFAVAMDDTHALALEVSQRHPTEEVRMANAWIAAVADRMRKLVRDEVGLSAARVFELLRESPDNTDHLVGLIASQLAECTSEAEYQQRARGKVELN